MENRMRRQRGKSTPLFPQEEIEQAAAVGPYNGVDHPNGTAVLPPPVAEATSDNPMSYVDPPQELSDIAGVSRESAAIAADNDLDLQPTPPRPGPELFFLRMKGNECHTFTVYSPALFGINVHYVGQRSSPHYRNVKKCPGCIANNPKRWKGYLHCYDHNLSQEVFLELTPKSADSLLSQLGKKGTLRGNRIQVKRTASDKGRLLISILTACSNPEQLPPGRDPLAGLCKLWGIDRLDDAGPVDQGLPTHDFE